MLVADNIADAPPVMVNTELVASVRADGVAVAAEVRPRFVRAVATLTMSLRLFEDWRK
jgi:hypothetical protein